MSHASLQKVKLDLIQSHPALSRLAKGATLGANRTMVWGNEVGAFAVAGALVNRDVKPYALMVGVPTRQVGWMSQYGEQLDLPLKGDASTRCQYRGR